MRRYLLDTVTVSELRRDKRRIDPHVQTWQQGIATVWLSVMTLNELRFGLRKLEGKDAAFSAILASWYDLIVSQPRRFRILDIDRSIAELAADFRAEFQTPLEDSLIAATARVHDLTLATRNTADFDACGIDLVNPWDPPS